MSSIVQFHHKKLKGDYFEFSNELYLKILEEITNKTQQDVSNGVEILKKWIKQEAHLPPNEDDWVLNKMLCLNKCSIEKTKSKLEMYYSAKNLLPEFFEFFSIKHKNIQKLTKQVIILSLPDLTPSRQRITVVRTLPSCKNDYSGIDYISLMLMLIETRLISNECSMGDIFLLDLENFTISDASKFTPRLVNNALKYIIGSYTDRIISLNFINVPTYAYAIIAIIKSILKTKLVERIHIHKDLNSLYQQIPKSSLPIEYGGELMKSLTELYDDWQRFILKNDDILIERSKMKSNEKLRVGEPLKSDMFGVQGSFQKLIID